MKDREGKVYCVRCQMYCITASEAEGGGVRTTRPQCAVGWAVALVWVLVLFPAFPLAC